MIKNILTKLGLSEKEAEIYLTLLSLGTAAASSISRRLNIPRQTVYSILEKLVESGFIEQSDKRGVKQFFCDPSDLLSVIEKQKTQLEKNKEILEKELPAIIASRKRSPSFPKIQYYEGEKGLKRLFGNILDVYKKGDGGGRGGDGDGKNSNGKIFRGYGINNLQNVLHGYASDFISDRFKQGIETRLFIAKGSDDFGITDQSNTLGRTVKRLNMDEQKAGMYVVDKKVYLFSYENNFGMIIEDEAVAKLIRDVFDTQWEMVES